MLPSLPQVRTDQNISNPELDRALIKGLDSNGLLRLKAVESAIYFFMGKSPTVDQFYHAYQKIFDFYTSVETKSK